MPATKCPACQYRNVGPAITCANCGSSLIQQHIEMETNTIEDEYYLPDRSQQRVIPAAKKRQGKSGRLPIVIPDHPEPEPAAHRYYEPVSQSATPYQTNDQGGFGSSLFPPTLISEEKSFELPDSFPRGLRIPRRSPDVTGIIVHVQSAEEFPDYPNFIRAIVDLLTEFIWIVPNQPVHKEGEHILVTTVRIRTQDGEKRDVRMQGYLRGANLSLGDMISFWGWQHKGSLIVRTGYNHTSKATVTTHAIGMLIPALIILLILAVGFTIFFLWRSSILHIPNIFPR